MPRRNNQAPQLSAADIAAQAQLQEEVEVQKAFYLTRSYFTIQYRNSF